MARWSKKKPAHVDTWFALRILEQTRKPFASAGAVKMNRLLFHDDTAGPRTRRTAARVLARQLHNVFVDAFGARLESRTTKAKAIQAMVAVLSDPKRSIRDLAETNDAYYRFFDEDAE